MNFQRDGRGFTILELMVAVAVVGVLASHTSQVITRTRITSNEGATLGNLQAVRNGFEMFRAFNLRYPNSMAELDGYVDRAIVQGQKHGYDFQLSDQSVTTYTFTAVPARPAVTGVRTFVLNESGYIQEFDGRVLQIQTPGGPVSVGWSLFLARLGSPISSFFWKFTNLSGQTLKNAAIGIRNANFGGPGSLGFRLLSEGLLRPSSKNADRIHLFRLGTLRPGESKIIQERVSTPRASVKSSAAARRAARTASRAVKTTAKSAKSGKASVKSKLTQKPKKQQPHAVVKKSASKSRSTNRVTQTKTTSAKTKAVAKPKPKTTTQSKVAPKSNVTKSPAPKPAVSKSKSPSASQPTVASPTPDSRWWYTRDFALYEQKGEDSYEEARSIGRTLSGQN